MNHRTISLFTAASLALLAGSALAGGGMRQAAQDHEPGVVFFSAADKTTSMSWSDGKNSVRAEIRGDTAEISLNGADAITINGLESGAGSFSDGKNTLEATAKDGRLTITLNGERILGGDQREHAEASEHLRRATRRLGEAQGQYGRQSERFREVAELARREAQEHVRRLHVSPPSFPGWAAPGAMSGQNAEPPRVMIGVTMESAIDDAEDLPEGVTPERATVINRVVDGLPAAKAGLHEDDIVIAINGSQNASPDDIRELLRTKNPGDTLKLTVLRDNDRDDGKHDQLEIDLRLEAFDAQAIGAPGAWGWRPSEVDLDDGAGARLAELRSELASLSEQLNRAGRAMGDARNAEERAEHAKVMSELGQQMAEIGAELARESAQSEGSFRIFGLGRDTGLGGTARVYIDRGDGQGPQAVIVPAPAPAPAPAPRPGDPAAPSVAPAAPAAPSADRLEAVNERLERVERLLEQLAEREARNADSKNAPSKPRN